MHTLLAEVPAQGPAGSLQGGEGGEEMEKGQAQWEDLQREMISWFISLKLMQIFVSQEPKSISCVMQANKASFPLQYSWYQD